MSNGGMFVWDSAGYDWHAPTPEEHDEFNPPAEQEDTPAGDVQATNIVAALSGYTDMIAEYSRGLMEAMAEDKRTHTLAAEEFRELMGSLASLASTAEVPLASDTPFSDVSRVLTRIRNQVVQRAHDTAQIIGERNEALATLRDNARDTSRLYDLLAWVSERFSQQLYTIQDNPAADATDREMAGNLLFLRAVRTELLAPSEPIDAERTFFDGRLGEQHD